MKFAVVFLGLVSMCGCHVPDPSTNGRVDVSSDDGWGSIDVVTVANRVGPELLSSDIIQKTDRPVLVAVSPFRGFLCDGFDPNLFLRRLRLELNQQSHGKVRFVAQGKEQGAVRDAIRDDANSKFIQALLDDSAQEIVRLPELAKGCSVAMLPPYLVNFVNLNPDSYLSMLRTKIVDSSNRKVRFTMPGSLEGADYYLSAQFIADSDKTEGMINLADYIRDLEKAEREGASVLEVQRLSERRVEHQATALSEERTDTKSLFIRRSRLPHEAQTSQALRQKPKVAKFLNLMIVNAKDKLSIYEKQLAINDVSTGLGGADYILSAEFSEISKKSSRYCLISLQLIDPANSVIVWETGYETKLQ